MSSGEGMAAETQMDTPARGRIGAVLAVLNLLGAGIVVFFALLAAALSCDDNCSAAPGWRNDPNAWQWSGIVVLALVIFGSALVLNFAMLVTRARHLRKLAVFVQLVAIVLLAVLSFTAADTHGGWTYLLVLFAFFGTTGGVAARSVRD